jgi:hypothetical protein
MRERKRRLAELDDELAAITAERDQLQAMLRPRGVGLNGADLG